MQPGSIAVIPAHLAPAGAISEYTGMTFRKLSSEAKTPIVVDGVSTLFAVGNYLLKPHQPSLIATGLAVTVPAGFELCYRQRTELFLSNGLTAGIIIDRLTGELSVVMSWNGYGANWVTWMKDNDRFGGVPFEEASKERQAWANDFGQARIRILTGFEVAGCVLSRVATPLWIENK